MSDPFFNFSQCYSLFSKPIKGRAISSTDSLTFIHIFTFNQAKSTKSEQLHKLKSRQVYWYIRARLNSNPSRKEHFRQVIMTTPPPPTSSPNWAALPAEVRQRIWYYVSDYWAGSYTHNPAHNAPIEDLDTNRDSQAGPPHVLSQVSRMFAADGSRIWPLLCYNDLRVNPTVRYLPPSAFHGVRHLTLTMSQAIFTLQFTIPHLSHDHQPNPATSTVPVAAITLPQAPSVRHIHIVHYFRSAIALRDPAVQTALWRLQAFARSFDVTVDCLTDNNPPYPLKTFVAITMQGPLITFTYSQGIGWNTGQYLAATETYHWRDYHFRRVNSPQRQALVEAHSYYRYAPLSWQEGRQAYDPTGRPYPAPRLPPRRILARPWDYPPTEPSVHPFPEDLDLEAFFNLSLQSHHDSILEDLESFFNI